ncbi:MAG: YlbF family regulator, partial [Clostridia bacterium]|nr:YlbF family regulator [Clostridia bacterium]
MDIIKLTRELGAAIQQDPKYKAFEQCKLANEADVELNELIGKMNLLQLNYEQEHDREQPDEEKLSGYDREFRELYALVMENENMKKYEAARAEIDSMMNYIMQILSLCVNGEDPET